MKINTSAWGLVSKIWEEAAEEEDELAKSVSTAIYAASRGFSELLHPRGKDGKWVPKKGGGKDRGSAWKKAKNVPAYHPKGSVTKPRVSTQRYDASTPSGDRVRAGLAHRQLTLRPSRMRVAGGSDAASEKASRKKYLDSIYKPDGSVRVDDIMAEANTPRGAVNKPPPNRQDHKGNLSSRDLERKKVDDARYADSPNRTGAALNASVADKKRNPKLSVSERNKRSDTRIAQANALDAADKKMKAKEEADAEALRPRRVNGKFAKPDPAGAFGSEKNATRYLREEERRMKHGEIKHPDRLPGGGSQKQHRALELQAARNQMRPQFDRNASTRGRLVRAEDAAVSRKKKLPLNRKIRQQALF